MASYLKKTVPTIDEYSKKSFDIHSVTRKKTTQDDYRISYEKHIKPYFGKRDINSLKPSDISLWQNKLSATLSPSRLKVVRAVLSTIFNDALRDEIITRNPLVAVKSPKLAKAEILPFSVADIYKILQNSQGQFRNFYALAFFTGMRSGEMIGLKWSDVNFSKNEIYIRQAIKMGVLSTPKTLSSIRYIDIVDSLIPYLMNQHQITGSQNSYVFLNESNEHFYDIKRIRTTDWKKVLKASGLKYRPIYHTRHSFATIMLENGEDILWVSNMLGHTDSTMTLSRYARYIKREDKKRASFLHKEIALNNTEMAPSIRKIG